MKLQEKKFNEYCNRLGFRLDGQNQISYHVGWIECKQEFLALLISQNLVNMSEIEEAILLEKIENL